MNLPVVRKAHADLGASKAERWMNCPGSVRMEADLPDRSSPEAREGTAAHMLAERSLRKRLDPSVWVGAEFEVEGEHVEVTDEMCDAVRVFTDHVWSQVDHKSDELFVERKFDLSPMNPPGPMYGTADAVVWKPDTRVLHVNDLKYGKGVVVDAKENPQLRYYGLGAVLEIGKRPRRILPTIVQPRAHHPDGVVRGDELTYDELVDFKEELFEAARETLRPDAPLNPGSWCRFCKAQAVCPAQRAATVELAQSEFDVVDEVALPAPARLSDDQIGAILLRADMVRKWFGAIEDYVREKLDRGEPVPGWKLVPKRANRRWTGTDEQVAETLASYGVDAYTRKIVSPAQAEQRLKEIAVSLAETGLAVEQKSSGSNVVPDSDSRPALAPSAQVDFDVVEDEKPKTRKRRVRNGR